MVLVANKGSLAYRCCAATLLLLCVLLPIRSLQASNQVELESVTDLRILVDVSGSMKRNDPNNLRRDALRLLIGMLPKTSRVGIWSFGQFVNMQVKPGFATPEWKKKAYQEANTIHSRGLFTNIEDTLIKSSWDWRQPDPKWDRHIILLTDGVVDISAQAEKNKISRQKILGKILGDLKAADVKIHTIALSAQADHELLKQLAKQSDGWYESVDSADNLQRIFLRLFEKTTKMDSLPLEKNYFDVDESVSDMTLLVFHSKSGMPTKIVRPDSLVFDKSTTPNNVEWYADKSFDIVTVHRPSKGRWKLEADIDKDNRVKIITNLKLRVEELPNNIIKDEAVTIKASLVTKDGLLDDKELLSLVKVTVHSSTRHGLNIEQQVPATENPGHYEVVIDSVNEVGDVQVIVRAIAPTFKRELRYEIKVHANPINLELTATPQGLVIAVTADPAILKADSLQLELSMEGQTSLYDMNNVGPHRWQAVIDNSFSGKMVSLKVSAIRIGNIQFHSTLHGKLPKPIIPMADPLKIWTEEIEVGLVVKVLLTDNLLQVGTLHLVYSLAGGHDDSTIIIIKQKTANLWQQLLLPEYSGKNLMVTATGLGLNGEKFEKSYQVSVPELPVQIVDNEKALEVEKQEHIIVTETSNNDAKADLNVLFVIGMIVLVNILLFAGGYFGYRYWKKRDRPITDDLTDAPVNDDDAGEQADSDIESVQDNLDISVGNGVAESDSSEDEKLNEDFSSQRKEKLKSGNVELSVNDADETSASDATDDADMGSDIIDTASADDLPDFDVDLESDINLPGKDQAQENKDG